MGKVFAMLVMGMSMAVAVGTAFANEPGKDSADHQRFPAPAVTRAAATNMGTFAGSTEPPSVWTDMRNENREH